MSAADRPGGEGARYVSRGGHKLRHALDVFGLDPSGAWCADLGCSTGGFTDCLLQAGAAAVYAVDTGYGVLAWKLRGDARVRVIERTSALRLVVPAELAQRGGADLVVIDLGWTPQRLAVPAALGWLCGGGGAIVTLIKPHYEDQALARSHRGVLPDGEALRVCRRVAEGMAGLGARLEGLTESPLRGGAGGTGNREWLALLRPAGAAGGPACGRSGGS